MADNVAITAGTGTTIASDDIGGVQYPRSKISLGADGSATDALGGTGAASSAVIRTVTASDSPDVTSLASIDTKLTSPLTVASHAVTNAGTFAVQVTSAPSTAVTNAGTFATQATVAASATNIAKAEDVASADADVGVPAMAIRQATPANTSGTDGDYEMLRVSAGRLWVDIGGATTIKSSVTRPADTNAYTANDAMSDSTSAPTSGGFTVTNAARFSGGSGIITDVIVSSSADPATTLQGEIWVLDQAGTNINDNAAFAMADADVLNVIAVIPFTLASTVAGSGTNSFAHVQGLNIGFTCVGTANLRYLLKVKNAYTPISAEVIQIAWKILQTT